ncbi:RNA polymerase sigma factor [Caulobacter segnis]
MTDLLLGGRDEDPAETRARSQLEALFRAQGPRMVRLLTRRAGGREEALDLVQEAFLRLTRATIGQTLLNPEFYLKRITRNLLRDKAKSVSGAIERASLPLEEEAHASRDGDPHAVLEARQTLARFETAVMRLKPKTREIYLLQRLDDLSYAQIAQRMDLSVSAVEKHMMRAIAQVDRTLDRI